MRIGIGNKLANNQYIGTAAVHHKLQPTLYTA